MDHFLIVNADDFGWTEGVNEGIIDAHRRGIVTSATLLAGGRATQDAAQLAIATPTLGVGVHLAYQLGAVLVDPRRLSKIFRTDGTPRLNTLRLWLRVTIDKQARRQLKEHFRSQIENVLDLGIQPTHLDTHKHIHYWPAVNHIVCELADEFSIHAVRLLAAPSRERPMAGSYSVRLQLAGLGWTAFINSKHINSFGLISPQRFLGIPMTGSWTKQVMLDTLDALPGGWSELMVHPGSERGLENEPTRLVESRRQEWDILIDPEVKERCQSNKINLASYRQLVESVRRPQRLEPP
jgi:predicted glycoside hydrolase/deacetylase ChbG (UPF0249 family)